MEISNIDQHYQIIKNSKNNRQNYLKVHHTLTSQCLIATLPPNDEEYEILKYLHEYFPTSHSTIPPIKWPVHIPFPCIRAQQEWIAKHSHHVHQLFIYPHPCDDLVFLTRSCFFSKLFKLGLESWQTNYINIFFLENYGPQA